MRFYKVTYMVEGGMSGGFTWHTSRRGAGKAMRAFNNPETGDVTEIEPVAIRPTKRGILSALNVHATHPDNG